MDSSYPLLRLVVESHCMFYSIFDCYCTTLTVQLGLQTNRSFVNDPVKIDVGIAAEITKLSVFLVEVLLF